MSLIILLPTLFGCHENGSKTEEIEIPCVRVGRHGH